MRKGVGRREWRVRSCGYYKERGVEEGRGREMDHHGE